MVAYLPSAWADLGNILDARGARIHQHFSRWILLTLLHGHYHVSGARAVVIELANRVLMTGMQIPSKPSNVRSTASIEFDTQNAVREPQSKESTAHNVAIRSKDKEKNFSGDLEKVLGRIRC